MSLALKNLLTLLNLEKIEEGLFRGQSEDLGLRQVLGTGCRSGAVCRQRKPYQKSVWSIPFTATFTPRR